MRQYKYFLKLTNESNRERVLHELENYLFHFQISHSKLWIQWLTENYSGNEILDRLKSEFLIDTWIEEN